MPLVSDVEIWPFKELIDLALEWLILSAHILSSIIDPRLPERLLGALFDFLKWLHHTLVLWHYIH